MRGLIVAIAALAASAVTGPQIVLSHGLPSLVRVGQRVVIRGHVHGTPVGKSAALQIKRLGATWSTLTRARLRRGGGFAIRWQVAKTTPGPVVLRVVALKHGRVLSHTATKQSAIGPAPVYCAPPVPPAVDIPVGDGWIEGGLYLEGGPFPGIYECTAQAYTMTAETSSGTVVASEHVAGGHSYTLAPVPAGTYMLRASPGPGFGSATVTSGKGTTANATIPVP